jgi:eukaryotic-like serine/threonine-protein kinase
MSNSVISEGYHNGSDSAGVSRGGVEAAPVLRSANSRADSAPHATDVPIIRVFISSPSDVKRERILARRIAERINTEYKGHARIELVLWERQAMAADQDFQSQIIETRYCDAVIGIFWERYGSSVNRPYEAGDNKPDYLSGSAYEILSAIAAADASRSPDEAHIARPKIYLLRKRDRVYFSSEEADAFEENKRQRNNLERFFNYITTREDGLNKRAFKEFVTQADYSANPIIESTEDQLYSEKDQKEKVQTFEFEVRQILIQLIEAYVGVRQPVIWGNDRKVSPFPGLGPFDPVHADVFFGRGQKVRNALGKLRAAAAEECSFLLIVGSSGAGKSSLMRAGLAPRITNGDIDPLVAGWRTAILRPGSNGLLELARALLANERRPEDGGFGAALPELRHESFLPTPEAFAQMLKRAANDVRKIADAATAQNRSFLDALRQSDASSDRHQYPDIEAVRGRLREALTAARPPEAEPGSRCRLLLMVDQLEELFAADVAEEARIDFAYVIALLAVSGDVWVIGTLRADLYEQFTKLRPLFALKDRGQSYDLLQPGSSEVSEIVSRSVAACGLTFEVNSVTGQTLDQAIIDDASRQNALPLLQFTLKQLYERSREDNDRKVLTFADYDAIGRIEGAVNRVAEQAISQLSGAAAKDIDNALPQLIRSFTVSVTNADLGTVQAARVAVRQRKIDDLRVNELQAKVLDVLINARILSVEQSDRGSIVSVAHEKVFESWARARQVLVKNVELISIRDAVLTDFQNWELKKPRDLLIPNGSRLQQAKRLLTELPQEVTLPVQDYIRRSISKALWGTRLQYTAIASIILFAIASGIGFWQASNNAESAQQNYIQARDAAGRLVDGLTAGLRDSIGLRANVAQGALQTIEPTIVELAKGNPTDLELKRIETIMHLEFARIFQSAVRDNAKTITQAEAAIASARGRLALSPNDPLAAAHLAQGLDLLGDARRSAKPDESVALYKDALALREKHYPLPSNSPIAYIYHSYSLIRLGDMEIRSPEREAQAFELYTKARNQMDEALKIWPDDLDSMREHAWTYRKLGFAELTKSQTLRRSGNTLESQRLARASLENFERAYCTRTQIRQRTPGRVLVARDVAYVLKDIAAARRGLTDFGPDAVLAALFEERRIREQLADGDRSNALLAFELVQTLQELSVSLAKLGELEKNAARNLIREANRSMSRFTGAEQISEQAANRLINDVKTTTTELLGENVTQVLPTDEEKSALDAIVQRLQTTDLLPACR